MYDLTKTLTELVEQSFVDHGDMDEDTKAAIKTTADQIEERIKDLETTLRMCNDVCKITLTELQQERERVEKAIVEMRACQNEFRAIIEELPQARTVLQYRIASIENALKELEAADD